jgi:hypothetical protein
MKRAFLPMMCVAVTLVACSRGNNLLLGRVEATVGGHPVVVTDCYRTSVPQPTEGPAPAGGAREYHFMPCSDADVLIRGDELLVNGKAYGRLKPGDQVTVDHGRVLINDRSPS